MTKTYKTVQVFLIGSDMAEITGTLVSLATDGGFLRIVHKAEPADMKVWTHIVPFNQLRMVRISQ